MFPGFLKASIHCLGKYPKVILSLGFLFVRLWVILSLGYFFLVHLSIMKEGTQPTNWGCSPNHLLLLFCWCFRGFLVGIDTQFILDTFSKVPLYCLSEVYNFDVVILCGPSLIFAGCIFGVGDGGRGWWTFRGALPAKWDHLHRTRQKEGCSKGMKSRSFFSTPRSNRSKCQN